MRAWLTWKALDKCEKKNIVGKQKSIALQRTNKINFSIDETNKQRRKQNKELEQ